MQPSDVLRVGVVGAGQMGRGIAQVAAASGYEVVLVDASRELAEKGRATIDKGLGKLVEKGKVTAADREALVGRIRAADGVGDLAKVELAVEAATENVDLKLAIFKDMDRASTPAGGRCSLRTRLRFRSRASPARRSGPSSSSGCTS